MYVCEREKRAQEGSCGSVRADGGGEPGAVAIPLAILLLLGSPTASPFLRRIS